MRTQSATGMAPVLRQGLADPIRVIAFNCLNFCRRIRIHWSGVYLEESCQCKEQSSSKAHSQDIEIDRFRASATKIEREIGQLIADAEQAFDVTWMLAMTLPDDRFVSMEEKYHTGKAKSYLRTKLRIWDLAS